MLNGYDQAYEDNLLNSFDWRSDSYKLFDHASLALSSSGLVFDISKSNCFAFLAVCLNHLVV